jgi:spore coat protein U-like protein
MMRRLPVGAAIVLFLLAGSRAEAAQCTISTTAVTFGTYNVFNPAPVDSTGTVRYSCNGGAKNIVISITRGLSSTFIPRTLKKGSESLAYNLFQDASRSTVWGDGSGGAPYFSAGDPPNNTDVTVTIFGRIPPSQDITAGAYSDSVTVMVLF